MKFLTIKKKSILICVFITILFYASLTTYFSVKPTTTPKHTHSIVIDAGHGGKDGGAIGKTTGITESELNLKYAKKLESLCQEFGFKTIMTRSDMNGLYEEFAQNKKKSEMEKRKSIINNSGADIMISIHMNSFPSPNCSGAQVFYASGSENGFMLAKSVQESICAGFENARDYVTTGDYFVLNYSSMPSILVECGFLSNPTEEKDLQNNNYCEKLCYHILAGIISYFEM